MTSLRDFSLIYSSLHSLILFLILFESKYPKKKTMTLTICFMTPLIILNIFLTDYLGFEQMGTMLLLTASLPSLIFFRFMSKYKGGRFLFTFCLADTLVLELIYLTGILGYYLGDSDLFLLLIRLFVFPIVELLFYFTLRPFYLEMQQNISNGWYTFASISMIFYILLSLSANRPTFITERTEYLPAFILLTILMPLLYLHFFVTLSYQQKNHEITERENILQLQVENMKQRMEEFHAADQNFRMERHNFRHKLQTITGLIDKKQYNELHLLINQYNEAIQETKIKRYSNHPILDSALSSYINRAEKKEITVTVKFDFPDILPVNEAELATVFANAIENAIDACGKMESSKRHIEIKVLSSPCFMLQIRNSFNGIISFNRHHIPVTKREGHGFGTRSIVAFCEKYNAFYSFKAENDLFSLQIMCDDVPKKEYM